MKIRKVLFASMFAAMIMTAGVCPLTAADWKGYAAAGADYKWFEVNTGSDKHVEVVFDLDSACTFMVTIQDENDVELGTYQVGDGAVLELTGGGIFYIFVWSEKGNCNWTASLADFGSVPSVTRTTPGGTTKPTGSGGGSVTDLEGESSKGTADCAGMIWDRVNMDTPADVTLYAKIDENCVPGMVCFTVGPGLYAEIDSSYFKNNGYNCATGAYIEDPGFVVVEGCCTEKVLYTYDCDKNGKVHETGRAQFFGPGKFTLQPSGGRNLMLKVEFNIYKQ